MSETTNAAKGHTPNDNQPRSDLWYERDIDLGFAHLNIRGEYIGNDLLIVVRGGEPHIGTVVVAYPRPSLTGDGTMSVTSSVLNTIGHKDEQICRYLAEAAATRCQTTAVCLGGFHIDDIDVTQINAVMDAVHTLVAEIKEV